MMGFAEAIRTCLSNYVTFSGRASRAEYWWFTLFNIGGSVLLQVSLGAVAPGGSEALALALLGAMLLWTFGLLLPALAVTARRLHDVGRSFWWYLIVLVPIVGAIVLLVWLCSRSSPETNRWGPPPQGGTEAAEVFA